ncbi:type II toxin-antitoxin system ParD family antitoxin [Pararhizobium sp. BT-229]|uniref:type II toxin-antitoxin system ParD family antitoxin n=1 Tax=Pararhizobium sp. BT-229 TaxID=2986923 RepID=UPI0021F6E573|nr:type II toxin-antitoxin system ParD family antitoxin [Pararhizobium sp. BT-229]MCV9965863.1 type II toxin-antitoxin system ParD family antitoxin [Pararhizobium sp. BT-229]
MSNAKKSFVIGDHFDGFIEEQVKSGRFNNASEVVRAGLRLLERDEAKFAELKRLIKEGLDDIENGDFVEFSDDDDLLAFVRQEAEKER